MRTSRSRPLPGQDRRGEVRRPVSRKAIAPAKMKVAAKQARADAKTRTAERNGVRAAAPRTGSTKAVQTVKVAAAKEKVGVAAGTKSPPKPPSDSDKA